MRVTLIAVGRLSPDRQNPERLLFDTYAQRLMWSFEVREIDDRKKLSGTALKKREAELISKAIPENARVIALDERGKNMTSRDLAGRLGAWRDDGIRDLAFLIGGADGLDGSLRERADLVLSFGSLTWPHMMVRAMLAEQLFRAQSILTGHPYHRD